jgi:hypothetical protein
MKYTRKQVTVRALEAAARAYERCAHRRRSAEATRRTGPPLGSAVLTKPEEEVIENYATRKD